MKKLSMAALAFSGMLALNSCATNQNTKISKAEHAENQSNENIQDVGLNLEYMDRSVRPQDDFFSFVNGGWYKQAEIPADKSSWGSFNELRENTDNQSLKILEDINSKTYAKGSEGQKIQDLYATYMDLNKRNALGISPLKNQLAEIDNIKNLAEFQSYINKATLTGDNPFYNWYAAADMKNSNMNAVYLGGPSLGLGKDYYQKENEANAKTLAEYQKFVGQMLDILQISDANAAQQIVDFEKRMAKSLLTLEEGRDANRRYNPKTVAELGTLAKNVNLPKYLKTVGVQTDRVIIGELKYYQNLDQFINQQNLPLMKNYMKYRLLASNASYLDKRTDDVNFNFYAKYLQGQKEQRAMNKRALSMVNGSLGEAFGKLYVEQYFPAEAKEKMEELISYLMKSYEMHIKELDWMSPETKTKALEKLSKFTVKVAYPDKWKDYSALTINSPKDGASLYDNMENISRWHYQRKLDKVGKPVDKTEWGMTPQTVNAYYSSSYNEIVFPAAILQPPFFNFKADPAVNFGGIGAVIGHEISHGFDDGGSRFDGDGNLNNWWTDTDRKNFDAKVEALAEQFSKYEPVKGSFINGKFTSGENIGDLGGASVAYDALQLYLKDHDNPGKINGFTQDQRFFMSWATVWRTKSTDQYVVNQVKTDPHSPGYYRAFAPLTNIDAFYKAFDIKPGDKLYRRPEERVKIW